MVELRGAAIVDEAKGLGVERTAGRARWPRPGSSGRLNALSKHRIPPSITPDSAAAHTRNARPRDHLARLAILSTPTLIAWPHRSRRDAPPFIPLRASV